MSAQNSDRISSFSANSRNVKNFQLNQKFRFIAIAAIIGVPIVIAIAAFSFYQRAIDPDYGTEIGAGTDETATVPASGEPVVTDQGTYTGQGTPTVSVSNTMPQGVTVALNSVEQAGLKNNAYVSADTSAIPAGTAVKIDRASWTAFSENLGSVNATFTLLSENRGGSITFENVNGTWRITGYSISNG